MGSLQAAHPDLRDSQMNSPGSSAEQMPSQMVSHAEEPPPKRANHLGWLSSRAFHLQTTITPAAVYDLDAHDDGAAGGDLNHLQTIIAGRAVRLGPMGVPQYLVSMPMDCLSGPMHEVIIDDSFLDEDKESDDEGDDEGDEDDESDESDDEMPALLEEESDNDLGEAEQISESDGSKSSNVSIVEPQMFADSGSMADRAHMLGVPTRSFRKIKRFGLPLVFCSVLWWLARSRTCKST